MLDILAITTMNKEMYLDRIGLAGKDLGVDLSCINILQNRHLLHIPFENLDIHWGKDITLALHRFYKKIVKEKRGGFCYELNSNFNELLKAIGFNTKIISARVANGEGGFGAEFDHLAILVKLEGKEEYLVDVGFGDFIAEPLKFEMDIEQLDPNGIYKIRKADKESYEVLKKLDDYWKSEYIFKNLGRDLNEFSAMCVHNQTSPESHFTKGKLCSLMTENGRKTLTEGKFIVSEDGNRKETNVTSDAHFYEILKREFDIER